MRTIALALALSISGTASALVLPADSSPLNTQHALSDSNVVARMNGGVLTLSGYFANAEKKQAALSAAKAAFNVEYVIDLTTIPN